MVKRNNIKLYGFLLGECLHVDISNKRLMYISYCENSVDFTFKSVALNDTTLRLLIYLLIHAANEAVSKEQLLHDVWEANQLSASSQRLWQVIKELKSKLSMVGMPDDFIFFKRGLGYRIFCKTITPLYYEIMH